MTRSLSFGVLIGLSCLPASAEMLLADLVFKNAEFEGVLLEKIGGNFYVATEEIDISILNIIEQEVYDAGDCYACYRLNDFADVTFNARSVELRGILKQTSVVQEPEEEEFTNLSTTSGHFLNYTTSVNKNHDVDFNLKYTTSLLGGTFTTSASRRGGQFDSNQTYLQYIVSDNVIQIGDINANGMIVGDYISGQGVRVTNINPFDESGSYARGNSYHYKVFSPAKYVLLRDGVEVTRGYLSKDIGVIENLDTNTPGTYILEIEDRFGTVSRKDIDRINYQRLLLKDSVMYDFGLGKSLLDKMFVYGGVKYGFTQRLTAQIGFKRSQDVLNLSSSINYSTKFGNFQIEDSLKSGENRYSLGYKYSGGALNLNLKKSKVSLSGGANYMFPNEWAVGASFRHSKGEVYWGLSSTKRFSSGLSISLSASKENIGLSMSYQFGGANASLSIKDKDINLYGGVSNEEAMLSGSYSRTGDSDRFGLSANVQERYTSWFFNASADGDLSDATMGFSGTVNYLQNKGVGFSRGNVTGATHISNSYQVPVKITSYMDEEVISEDSALLSNRSYRPTKMCFETSAEYSEYSLKRKCVTSRVIPGQVAEYGIEMLTGGTYFLDSYLDNLGSVSKISVGGFRFSYYPENGSFIEGLVVGVYDAEVFYKGELVCTFTINQTMDYQEVENVCGD